jgi:hypothetical protein
VIGLARMALSLAYNRYFDCPGRGLLDQGSLPMPRTECARIPCAYGVSERYYEIIDRLSRGEAP